MFSSKPLVLDDARACYLVRNSTLDVFLVRSGKGLTAGQRHFLFTAKVGDVLLGLGPEVSGDWRLAAAGDAASLVDKLEVCGLSEMDNWLTNLTVALIGHPVLSAKTEVLAPTDEASFPAGTRLTVRGNVVWARLEQGRAAFMDGGSSFGLMETGIFTPLAGRAWITVEEDARFSASDTPGLLAGDHLPGAMAAFYRRLIAGVEARLSAIECRERQRLEAKARCDRSAFSGALAKVASVLSPGKLTALDAAGTDDPLFAACRLVAKASQIQLTGAAAPPGGDDPL